MNEFCVCLHDISPGFRDFICRILDSLHEKIGNQLSLAIIPKPCRQDWSDRDSGFRSDLREGSSEILLHGFTHDRRNGRGIFSWLTGHADEFASIPRDLALEKIRMGQDALFARFGVRAKGFVPPAWQWGPLALPLLESCEIAFGLHYFRLQTVQGKTLPLSPYSWDCGRIRNMGYASETVGRVSHALTHAVPSIVIHPVDWERGFFTRAERIIQSLLDRNYHPTLFGELVKRAS